MDLDENFRQNFEEKKKTRARKHILDQTLSSSLQRQRSTLTTKILLNGLCDD